MSAMDDILPGLPTRQALGPALQGARGLLISLGIAILAAISMLSYDRAARDGTPPTQDAQPAIEDWKGNSGSLPDKAPLPPALRRGSLN